MPKWIFMLTFLVFIVAGCEEQKSTIENENQLIEIESIAKHLSIPWQIAYLDGTFYISERTGKIVTIQNGKVTRHDVELEKTLSNAAEAGLLGFVLAPDFSQTKKGYAYYTYDDGRGPMNRVITLLFTGEVWKETSIIIDEIPSGAVHHGGRLLIGPDGYLYVTTGDGGNRELAQSNESLAGKILRFQLDGSIPKDNPDPNSPIYSFGHRNPQGLVFDSDGTLYASEHGNSANDEINIIRANANYGWPIIEGYEKQEGMETPLFTSGSNTTWAPSGMDYEGETLFVAALRGNAVLKFNLKDKSVEKFIEGYGRIRDVMVVDNTLYFITNNTDGRGQPSNQDDQLYAVKLN